jgi:dienelactone hydrolase
MRQALESRSLVTAPAPTGANKVGTRVLDLVDPKRTDPYSDHHRNRELPVRLWYPMTADVECMPAPYAPAQVWSYLSKLIRVPLPHVSTHSCLNGPVTGGQHSVVFLEHGFTGTFTDYTFLAEDLASRGYVVVAVDHAGEATAVEFPDGRLEKSVFGSYLTNYSRSDMGALGFAVAVRLDDLRFVLDELERMGTESASPFEGRVDMSHVALVGHSLGGLTTLRGLESNERFKAGVLLDGVMPPNFSTHIQQPLLHVVAGRDRWNQDDCLLWGSLRGKRRAIELPSVEHLALSDAAWLLEGGISTGGRGVGDTIAAIRQEVANFLDTNLRGKDSEALAGKPMAGISNAVIAGQADSLCAE